MIVARSIGYVLFEYENPSANQLAHKSTSTAENEIFMLVYMDGNLICFNEFSF